jgi:hypothetical protein
VDQEPTVVDDAAVGEVPVPPVAADPEAQDSQRSAGASVSARLAP